MRVVFMGTPAYVISVLEALLSAGCRIVGVYTQPDKPRGRGRAQEAPPVKSFALTQDIDVFQPVSLRRDDVQRELAALSPDVIVVAAYGKILPAEVLKLPPHGCINVHPSLLPRYRGPSPVASVILEGDGCTGTTIMLMDEGTDTGPVLTSRSVPIDPGNVTTGGLTPLLFQLGGELLKEALSPWIRGEVKAEPQNQSQATLTKKLEKRDGEARWETSAEELERRLRAFTPWPGLFTYWKGKLLKIISAAPLSSLSSGGGVSWEANEPGLVVPLEEPDIAAGVVTGKGVLGLRRLQLEGRRPASSQEFIQGYGDFLASKLPS